MFPIFAALNICLKFCVKFFLIISDNPYYGLKIASLRSNGGIGGVKVIMLRNRIKLGRMLAGLIVFGLFSVPIHGIVVESYSFESFSIPNPSFTDGTSSKRNLNGTFLGPSNLVVLAYKYGVLGLEAGLPLRSIEGNVADELAIESKILGTPLFYPNPFSISSGAELGYKLSKNMDLEVRMYDIRANEIFRKTFVSGTYGGISGYNKVFFDLSTLGRYELPSGIYFFVLINNGKVLGRGKFAVKP